MLLCFFIFLLTGCGHQEKTATLPSALPSATSAVSPAAHAASTTTPALPKTPSASTTTPAASHKAPSSLTTAPASSTPSDAEQISETLTANDALLAKYIKASGNGLISLVGLGDLMEEVKTEAETASGYTGDCLELTKQLTGSADLPGYCEQFLSVQLNLTSLNVKMKAAKQNKDIDEIESALTYILEELQSYSKLLEQFLEKER